VAREAQASAVHVSADFGPYGAAHLMMLLGRHSRLILDSWTRPKYAKVNGRKAGDATVQRRFRRYGSYSGLGPGRFVASRDSPEFPISVIAEHQPVRLSASTSARPCHRVVLPGPANRGDIRATDSEL